MQSKAKKPKILLAVTGSVAGVKGPELAVRIHLDCNATVRVLLTKGGTKFWDKAKDYNRHYWDAMIELSAGDDRPISVYGASDEGLLQ